MTTNAQQKYIIEKLDSKHNKQTFNCGSILLDNYLKTQASQDIKKNVSVTYALIPYNNNEVIGYYTLSTISIDASELPDETVKKLPKYPMLPGILLGRLAVDATYHGNGIGAYLLIDSLQRSLMISNQIGINAVVVDAKDNNAVNFYAHYSFIAFPSIESKLFLPIKTIEKLQLNAAPIPSRG